uniref:Olfactory receptor family 5 subfamily K member 4 n=1 Tax=Cebus imitator TaxID=2715852 RepID=A0A2K5RT26_CEBIM
MAKENHSLAVEFILTGFTNYPKLKTLLFVVFSAIYLVTMHCLHTPMYIFLGNLAVTHSCCSCAATPKMLENFFSEDRIISLYECMVGFYFLCLAETTDCFLLVAMAYDCYVIICHPLQYHTMMSKTLCIQMTAGAFIAGHLHSMIHVGLLLRLTFCKSNKIDHFFVIFFHCIDSPVLRFLCKAFSICVSHFFSVSIFYICLLMYIRPFEGDKDIPVAIFCTIVIPLLSPFIYSLRHKEVINVLKKYCEEL